MVKPYERHTVEDFLKYNLQELFKRRFMANLAIRAAREELENDYRAPKALEYYLAEREAINGAIKQLRWNGSPPNQQIELKQLNFGSQAKV